MILAEASNTLELIVALVGAAGTLIGAIIALIQAIKAKNYKKAKEEGMRLLTTTVKVIDAVKKNTDGDAREILKTALKSAGGQLDSMGLKAAMDSKLKELGVDDKS
jgi:hypothetical protein